MRIKNYEVLPLTFMLIRCGGSAASYLDIVLSVIEMTGANKEYKEGAGVDSDIALSTL